MWNWIKVPKGVALLAFLLPWMSISCSNQKIVSATGFGMAFGRFKSQLPVRGSETPDGDVNLWLILALLAITIGLVAALRSAERRSALIVMATSFAALVLIWVGTARYSKSHIAAEVAQRNGGNGFSRMDEAALAMIQVDWHIGYWLTMMALVASAAMSWLVYSGREDQFLQSVRRAGPSTGATAAGTAEESAPEQSEGPTTTCPRCQRAFPLGTRFCQADGTRLEGWEEV